MEEIEKKMNILYSLVTNIHQSNVQILRNQIHLLQQHQSSPNNFEKTENLIQETKDTLRQITSGKE